MSEEEILDLVNENDEIIGQMPRSEVLAKKLKNKRVINAFIMNDEGKIWIPRRSPTKSQHANALDASVGGHVSTGEDYDTTLVRETMEEVRLDVTQLPHRLLGKLTPHEHGTSAFMQVYEIRANEVPNYNPEDFSEYYWLTPHEIFERMANGDVGKPSLSVMLRHFYGE